MGLLRELNAAGTTVFLTTHYLEEAETLCRNIGIIEGGRLVALEPTSRLLERHGRSTLTVHADGPFDALPADLAARVQLARGDSVLRVESVAAEQVGALLADLTRAGVHITAVDYGRASLQDVFLELTRK